MARLSKNDRDTRIGYAKKLYVKGFDTATIADMLGFAKTTIDNWAATHDFELAKRAANISISEIRNEILSTYETMRKGEKPAMNPDQISKLVAGFEKLTPNQKSVTWIIEAFDLLTEKYVDEIKAATTEKDKNKVLQDLKTVRAHADKVISKIVKELME